jgi:hypothetical protein
VRTLSDADVRDADVLAEDYVLRSPGSEEHETLSGLSVGRALGKVGYAPGEGFLRTDRADGTWATLSADDVGDPSPFQDGRKPLVFLDSARTRFFRPVRNGSDENARDNLATQSGEPLEIWVQSGAPLRVTATASRGEAAKGEPVSFSATVSGERGGEAVSVRWRFDDGTTAQGATAQHAYDADGVYGVVAVAQGDQDSGGASDVLRVRVGSPQSGGPGDGGGTATGPAPATGPNGGPSTGTGTTKRRRKAGGTGTDTIGDDSSARGSPRPRATATPVPAATVTAPAPAATPVPGGSRTSSPGPASRAPRATKRNTPAAAPAGEIVRGVLVSASAPLPLPAASTPARAGARAAAQAGVAAAPLSLGALAALLLLAGGAWREATGARLRRRRP